MTTLYCLSVIAIKIEINTIKYEKKLYSSIKEVITHTGPVNNKLRMIKPTASILEIQKLAVILFLFLQESHFDNKI